MITPSALLLGIHTLLDNCPCAARRKKESVVINLIAILHQRTINPSRHFGAINKILVFVSGSARTSPNWRISSGVWRDVLPLPPQIKIPSARSWPRIASFNAAIKIVVSPEEFQSKAKTVPSDWNQNRIGNVFYKFIRPIFLAHDRNNLPAKLNHAPEKPRRTMPVIKAKRCYATMNHIRLF